METSPATAATGPWSTKPGQDLLVQSLSGLPWLNGDADQPPVPFGLAVSDMMAGAHLVQGILACLVRRGITGAGGHVEVSLLESTLDLQFEVLTTYLNDGGKLPQRSAVNNAHAYLGAPYGIYKTSDGYIALAMQPIVRLGELLGCAPLLRYTDPKALFDQRDEIKSILVEHLKQHTTAHWLGILEPADVWCADVFNWDRLFQHEAFHALDMVQSVGSGTARSMRTTRCPIRIDGDLLTSPRGAPRIGEHNNAIAAELNAEHKSVSRTNTFRIAVRKYRPFESAIAKQWASFDAEAQTGLTLEAIAMDLHPLEDALLTSNGMSNGEWDVCFIPTDWIAAMHQANAAVDLAPLLATDPIPDFPTAWVDSLLRLQRMDDAILGTPYHDGPECLVYRKDIFNDTAATTRLPGTVQ